MDTNISIYKHLSKKILRYFKNLLKVFQTHYNYTFFVIKKDIKEFVPSFVTTSIESIFFILKQDINYCTYSTITLKSNEVTISILLKTNKDFSSTPKICLSLQSNEKIIAEDFCINKDSLDNYSSYSLEDFFSTILFNILYYLEIRDASYLVLLINKFPLTVLKLQEILYKDKKL